MFKHKHLIPFASWLNSLYLSGHQSRMRSRFIRKVKPLISEDEEERNEILSAYAKKDDKGEFIVVKDPMGRDSYDLSDEDAKKFDEEYKALQNKEVDFGDENKPMMLALKDIVLNTDTKIGPEFSEIYEEACEILEKVA